MSKSNPSHPACRVDPLSGDTIPQSDSDGWRNRWNFVTSSRNAGERERERPMGLFPKPKCSPQGFFRRTLTFCLNHFLLPQAGPACREFMFSKKRQSDSEANRDNMHGLAVGPGLGAADGNGILHLAWQCQGWCVAGFVPQKTRTTR